MVEWRQKRKDGRMRMSRGMRSREDKRADKEGIVGEARGAWGGEGGGWGERSVRSYHQVRWPELRGSKKKEKKKKSSVRSPGSPTRSPSSSLLLLLLASSRRDD